MARVKLTKSKALLRNSLGQWEEGITNAVSAHVANISKARLGKYYEDIIRFSPVETGAFRRSIRITKGHPDYTAFSKSNMFGEPPFEGSGPTEDEKEASGYNALMSSKSSEFFSKNSRKRTYYITATVEDSGYSYAQNIEFSGWYHNKKRIRDPYAPFAKAAANNIFSKVQIG